MKDICVFSLNLRVPKNPILPTYEAWERASQGSVSPTGSRAVPDSSTSRPIHIH
jgi:hypothetical protein